MKLTNQNITKKLSDIQDYLTLPPVEKYLGGASQYELKYFRSVGIITQKEYETFTNS